MTALHSKIRSLVSGYQGPYAFLKYNSPVKLWNLLLTEFQRVFRRTCLVSYPYKLIVDTTNICNLKCLYCPTGKGEIGRQKGFMTFDHFKSIVDELGRYTYIVDLFNWGEPLLNKDICKMVAYAESNNICTNIHTNLNCEVTGGDAENIIQSGLSFLSVSLDGANQQVYSTYRRKGDLEKALHNARILIELREKSKKKKPFITWQFLVFPHNRHHVERAHRLSREMGFDSFKVLAGVMPGGLGNITKAQKDEIKKLKDIEKNKCDWLWTTATFHWDQAVAPCCLQFKKDDDFGSAKDERFKTIWNNETFMYARSLIGRKGATHGQKVICNNCFKVMSPD